MLGEKNKKFLQNRASWLFGKFSPLMSLFLPKKMVHCSKIQFFSYRLKCSQPVRLQYSLIINIFARNHSISQIFCMEIMMMEIKQHLILPPFVACGQMYLLSNLITGFFDLYLWKESIDIFNFLYGDNHQRKVPSETTTFGWV